MGKKKTTARRASSPKRACSTAPDRCFCVKLPHVPSRVIEHCATPEEAFRHYKKMSGIVQTDHEPTIEPVVESSVAVKKTSPESSSWIF